MDDLQTPSPEDTAQVDQVDASQVEPEEDAPKEAAKEAPKKHRSAREALEKAFAGGSETKPTDDEVKAAEPKPDEPKEAKAPQKDAKQDKPAEKDEAKSDGPQRGPDGKFAAKDADKAPEKADDEPKADSKPKGDQGEAPARFSPDAKAEWEKAPESVRAEAHRAIREMEKGIAQKDEILKPLEPFVKMASEQGTTIHDALGNYIRMEQQLRQNPRQGLIALAQNMGMTPQQMGQILLGQQPGQADPRDQQIMTLHRELQQMKQQFGAVSQNVEQQREQAIMDQVAKFAQGKPRFDELSGEIVQMLETGYASDLEDAYNKAERLNPAPQPAPEPEPTPAPPVQTRPARSLTGAPSPGSNPTMKRTPAKNPREALTRHLFG